MAFPQNPSSFDDYGSVKQDYIGVVDPTFDRSADEVNQCFSDCAAMTGTAVLASCSIGNTGSGPFIVATSSFALWGNTPDVVPTITSIGAGEFNVTFPASTVDEFGNSNATNISKGWANLSGSFGFCQVIALTPNSVKVKLANTSGASNALTGTIVNLFVAR